MASNESIGPGKRKEISYLDSISMMNINVNVKDPRVVPVMCVYVCVLCVCVYVCVYYVHVCVYVCMCMWDQ